MPDLEVETWYALFAPAGTPGTIVAQLNREANRLLQDPQVKDVLSKQGLVPAGGTPEALGERVTQEVAKWSKLVKDRKLTFQ